MAPPVLYSADISPPCRGVLLCISAAGIEVDVKEVNLGKKDHLKEEFLKMNPQHTVPTLDDNGFVVGDSHAIVTYLVDKYAKDDSLYPKDLKKRTIVNQRLHFDNAVLFNNIRSICYPIFFEGSTEKIPQAKIDAVKNSFEFLEKFLGDNDWLAGSAYTLADTCAIASVSSLTALVPLDNYPKLDAWVKKCENEIPGYATANAPGAEKLYKMFSPLLD